MLLGVFGLAIFLDPLLKSCLCKLPSIKLRAMTCDLLKLSLLS